MRFLTTFLATPLVLGVVFLAGLAHLLVAAGIGLRGWDDGAITVAFARTLALYGEVALTAASDRVEGSSSLLYMAILSVLIPTGDDMLRAQILTSQWLTAACFVATAALLYTVLRDLIPSRLARGYLVALYLILPPHFRETMNGMEMALFALLLLGWVYAAETRRLTVELALVPLILLTRFEGVFYIGFVYAALLLVGGERGRGYAFRCGLYVTFVFAMITLGRWFYFGDIMPNTVWAKMHPPYSLDAGILTELAHKMRGLSEVFSVLGPVLFAGVLFAAVRPLRPLLSAHALWLVAAFLLFAVVTGRNNGYDGRMIVGLFPVAILLLVRVVRSTLVEPSSDRPAFAVVVVALLAMIFVNIAELKTTGLLVLKNLDETGRLPPAIAMRVEGQLARRDFPANPQDYAQNGRIADRLRMLTGRERLVIMAPDVGGVGLCCASEALRVVDNALLTNRQLARLGLGALPDVLDAERPDVILTHFIWAGFSGIYTLPVFEAEYRPMVFDETLFWVRRDIRDGLLALPGVRLRGARSPDALKMLRNDLRASDRMYLESETPHRIEWVDLPDT